MEDYHLSYKDQIDSLKTLLRILEKSETAEEFSIECIISGYGFLTSRSFFDDVLFPFIFRSRSLRGEVLRLVIDLKDNIAKLNKFYQDFISQN